MAKKGDLVEFKAGLFGIAPPDNYAIFIKSFRHKKSKTNMVELYTTQGKQVTKQANMEKKSFGKSVPLKGTNLPETKVLKSRLASFIAELQKTKKKIDKTIEDRGQLSQQALWQFLSKEYPGKEFPEMEMASIWYELPAGEISRNRMKKFREIINECRAYGKGYFDYNTNSKNWLLITDDERKLVNMEIGKLGALKNKMFHMVEVIIDEEDPEETEMQRKPLPWDDISFSQEDLELLERVQKLMANYVEYNNWLHMGMGGTHIIELDGFSLHNYISYLGEDYVDEGRTSYADAFVKFLIRSGYWSDTEALYGISRRAVNLAQNFDWETPDDIEQIAAQFKEPKDTPGAFDGRTDLQHLEFYTIDPPTAKDFDDAVALDITDDGYVLWVAIADVAHYVKKDSSLDLHARRRATSVYLPTRTLPMLPTHLSDNLCSLNELLPRLSMTVEIHYDKQGNKKLDKCKVHNSVINVKKNLHYNQVNESIENQEEPFYSLNKFSKILQSKRRGLNIQTGETRLELGGQMELSLKTASNSTRMIESFMVAANETVAEILHREKLPVVYRNHALPDKVDVERFNMHAKVIGIDFEIEYPDLFASEKKEEEPSILDMLSQGGGGNISFSIGAGSLGDTLKDQLQQKEEDKDEEVDLGTPLGKGLAQLSEEKREEILKPFRAVLDKVDSLEDGYLRKLGYLIVLRTLTRAGYNAGNMGHFGLGSTHYLHFTSPIRRYPDIIAHRVCKAMIASQDLAYTAEEIDEVAVHCTEQSEMAEKLERTIVGAGFSFLSRNPDYQENKQGIVSSISGGGVYVVLPNGIEARIPLQQMASGPTFVDEYDSMCFLGTKGQFKIEEEVNPDNWRDLIQGEDDEPVVPIAKLGDMITIEFSGWDHIEGRVQASPTRILSEEEEEIPI